jgi:SAM-dependent methyltransferase
MASGDCRPATNVASVTGDVPEYSLYTELAGWWPVISPPAEYASDAAAIAAAFTGAAFTGAAFSGAAFSGAAFTGAATEVGDVLDLGSGGGHVASHLKDRFSLTLVDLSEQMLTVSRQLNPECAHVRGDMLTVRLGRQFDAVLVHDAVDYVTCPSDLRLVIETAFAHCRAGGVAVFAPDHTAETFQAGTGGGGGSEPGGRQASFLERTTDPDPADDWILAEYEFTLRDADGSVRVVREAHRLGSFPRDTWLTLLAGAGFEAEARLRTDAGLRRVMFVGRRPAPRRVRTSPG